MLVSLSASSSFSRRSSVGLVDVLLVTRLIARLLTRLTVLFLSTAVGIVNLKSMTDKALLVSALDVSSKPSANATICIFSIKKVAND